MITLNNLGKIVKRVLVEKKNVKISRLNSVYEYYKRLITYLSIIPFAKKSIKYQNKNLGGLAEPNRHLALNKTKDEIKENTDPKYNYRQSMFDPRVKNKKENV